MSNIYQPSIEQSKLPIPEPVGRRLEVTDRSARFVVAATQAAYGRYMLASQQRQPIAAEQPRVEAVPEIVVETLKSAKPMADARQDFSTEAPYVQPSPNLDNGIAQFPIPEPAEAVSLVGELVEDDDARRREADAYRKLEEIYGPLPS